MQQRNFVVLVRPVLLGACCALTGHLRAQPIFPIGNIFKPTSTPAQSIHDIAMLTLAICGVIFLVVAGLLTYTLIRFRHRDASDGHEPAQVSGSNQIEIAWTVIPILIVLVLTMATARVISAVQNRPMPSDVLQVTVVGHQWWWEIRYPALGVVTANELHVPVSSSAQARLTQLTLQSADVAHGFWVPQLAGKTDVIPNRTNTMWMDPRVPGIFLGNCSEYCGTQHANMLLRVTVQSPEDFERWVAQQKATAASDTSATGARNLFVSLSCVNCHTVSGTPAVGTFGPNLSHLMSRDTIAAGATPNSVANLRAWVRDPQTIKPGNYMPSMQLNDREVEQVVDYLATLK
jgi:cytochrome c oxidase subunit 2